MSRLQFNRLQQSRTGDKPKRRYRAFWMLPPDQQPFCDDCHVPCVAQSSPPIDSGRKSIQKRKCPCCGKCRQTIVHNE